MSIALTVILAGLLAWLVQIALTRRDNFFSVKQMLLRHGKGLPMFYHMGIMWGDPFFVTPLTAYLVAEYGESWEWKEILIWSFAALVLSAVMHYQYLTDKIENSHMHDKRLTPAAYIHFLYMWGALTVLGLFYTSTPNLNAWIVVGASVGLWVHMFFGTHTVIKIWSPAWFPPQPVADRITKMVWGGSAIFLFLLSAWALL